MCKTDGDDRCAHKNPSRSAIAANPANASAIRCTVMRGSFVRMIRHAPPRAGHPRLSLPMLSKGVDGRDKPGHEKEDVALD